ncbi:MAG: tRNA (adenosine(37)-N6)-threonylcarbamoyltransferase complex transferase subunit TsaD [Anaerolineaceae bacterium]|nr:tRNA (adenosine(37)-N6)-threonylcarbamoyltransferase complex transferase subunit TsaD [Anaerolineaceae bacterium]
MNPKSSTRKKTRILAIESSCDETAAAVLVNGTHILSNVVASQVELHAQYGGIFPEMASREHILAIYPVVGEALQQAHLGLDELDAIAVTRGPGLAGSLVVGMNMAKALSLGSGIPLIGINHLEGHLYSAWVNVDNSEDQTTPKFPLIALIVSGGHTSLILMKDHLTYEHLGSTLDDASGEAFDKVARLLGLPYPGGPSIQQAAGHGSVTAFNFPRARLGGSFNFSFSGLKTAVLREVKKLQSEGIIIPVNDIAASFQAAVVDVLVEKTFMAAERFSAQHIIVAGGVSANRALRKAISNQKRYQVHIPPINLCTDNAVMIAVAGYFRFINGFKDNLDIDVLPNWPLI